VRVGHVFWEQRIPSAQGGQSPTAPEQGWWGAQQPAAPDEASE